MKRISKVIIAILIALQLYSLVQINSLQRVINNTNNTINSFVHRLDNQMNSIYQNVDERLAEQASFIHRAGATLGSLDRTTLSIPITFTVEPKTITRTIVLSLDFNGEIVKLDKTGLIYSTTRNVQITEAIFPKIVIEDDGVMHIEEHIGLHVSNIKEQVFPFMFAHFSGKSSYNSNRYNVSGRLDIEYKPSQEKTQFIDINYIIEVNEKIIKELPVIINKENEWGGVLTLTIDDLYSLDKGDILTTIVIAKDSLGFTHQSLVTHYVAGSKAQREPYFDQVKIMAPNGEMLYLMDENIDEKAE